MFALLLVYIVIFVGIAAGTLYMIGSSTVRAQSAESASFFSCHARPDSTVFGHGGTCATEAATAAVAALPPAQRSLLAFLESACCVLPARSASIEVLQLPKDFYETLKRKISEAEHTVLLSALYVGDGPLSRGLMDCLIAKTESMLAAGRPFRLTMLLDYNRMLDRRNLVTLRELLELAHRCRSPSKEEGEEGGAAASAVAVELHLYQNASRLNNLFAYAGRAKEAQGVQHTKIFCFDGRDTLLTGANLSDDYFDTRIDRYITIDNSEPVAHFFTALTMTLVGFSHPVMCHNGYEGVEPQREPRSPLQKAWATARTATPASVGSPRVASPTLHSKSNLVILPNTCGTDPSIDPEGFNVVTAARMAAFAAEMTAHFDGLARRTLGTDGYDTVLFPTVQLAHAGVYHDSYVIGELLGRLSGGDRVYLTSPYLNLHPDFTERVIEGSCHLDCITASVHTNGWRGQKGLAGYIPFFYLQLERSFYFLMKAYGCLSRVRIREFAVEGLTFHAKGLWVASRKSAAAKGDHQQQQQQQEKEKKGNDDDEDLQLPYLVAYGSNNYGYRSVHRDVESEALLFTTSPKLRAMFRDELRYLLERSVRVEERSFYGKEMGRFQPVVSLLAQIGQDYL